MKPIYLAAITTLSLSATVTHAQLVAPSPTPAPNGVSGNITLINQDRLMEAGTTKRFIQSNITLKGSIDLNGIIQINTIVQTGNTFNVGYNNIYDTKKNEFSTFGADTKLYLKKLNLKTKFMDGNATLSAGAMDTRTSIAQTNSLSSVGWVDGARADIKTDIGMMTITAGDINAAQPSMLDRVKNENLNYFEITLSRKMFDKMLFEGGVESLEGKTFIESASKYDIEIAANKVIKLVADAKLETDNGAIKVGVGVQDILSLISKRISDVKLSVNYEYVSKDFSSSMNKLANTMHTGYTGGAVVGMLQYPVSKKYGITGYTNVRVGNDAADFRLETGFAKTIFNKSFKKKTQN